MPKFTKPGQYRDITPGEAEEILKLNDFPGQRPLDQWQVRQYADEMRAGRMRRIEIDIATVDKRKYLVNGQHVCHAVVVYGKPYPGIVTHYRCATYRDVVDLYSSFDTQRIRTVMHIAQVARENLPSDHPLRTLPTKIWNNIGSALWVLKGIEQSPGARFHMKVPNKRVKAELVLEHEADALWCDSIIRGVDSKNGLGTGLSRVGVVAAIIATGRANRAKAEIFWAQVRDGEMLKRDDPAMILRTGLAGNMYAKFGVTAGTGYGTQRAVYSYCVRYWGVFMGAPPIKVYRPSAEPPPVLTGNE